MDAEACVSSQRLKIDKEAAMAERGLLTHGVWSLGWQLSGIKRSKHYQKVKQFSHLPLCCCGSEGEQHFGLNALQLNSIQCLVLGFFLCTSPKQ